MKKAMAPHCSTLAWKIPWMEEPGRLQSGAGAAAAYTHIHVHVHTHHTHMGVYVFDKYLDKHTFIKYVCRYVIHEFSFHVFKSEKLFFKR